MSNNLDNIITRIKSGSAGAEAKAMLDIYKAERDANDVLRKANDEQLRTINGLQAALEDISLDGAAEFLGEEE